MPNCEEPILIDDEALAAGEVQCPNCETCFALTLSDDTVDAGTRTRRSDPIGLRTGSSPRTVFFAGGALFLYFNSQDMGTPHPKSVHKCSSDNLLPLIPPMGEGRSLQTPTPILKNRWQPRGGGPFFIQKKTGTKRVSQSKGWHRALPPGFPQERTERCHGWRSRGP